MSNKDYLIEELKKIEAAFKDKKSEDPTYLYGMSVLLTLLASMMDGSVPRLARAVSKFRGDDDVFEGLIFPLPGDPNLN